MKAERFEEQSAGRPAAMDASQAKQIKRGAPGRVWDGNWWPTVVADAERAGRFLIVRFENGVTVPVERARLQARDPTPRGADKPRHRRG